MPDKRVVIVSDFHCGSLVGLTPPAYQIKEKTDTHTKRNKWARTQRALWNWYEREIRSLGKVDVAIVNGDAIDGTGHRSGGTEQISCDREEQADMAVECIHKIQAKHKIMTYGTAYHTGDGEDWENVVADRCGAEKIGSHEWVDVNGVVFDCKHHLGSSTVPHGRHTAIAKERLWSTLWSERDETPRSDIIIRSHVHYFTFCGGPDWLGITTPALQGYGSKYGARRCSGYVDFGFLHFDITTKGEYSWKAHLARPSEQKAQAFKI